MRLDFSTLWMVLDPSPTSELCDIMWCPGSFQTLEMAIVGGSPADRYCKRNPTIYTDAAEALSDAEARIAARDRALWVPLASLPAGAAFVSEFGDFGIKRAEPIGDGRCRVVYGDGCDAEPVAALLVRRVNVGK